MRRLAVALCAVAFSGVACGQAVAPPPPPPQDVKQAEALKLFAERVQQYVDLRKRLDASLPSLGAKEPQEKIVARQRALARKIREARAGAKQGDVFAEGVAEEFRRLVRSELQGPKGANARKTVNQGEPVKPWRLRVGDTYPETVPITTMPPALLLKLPPLPEELRYQIVGRDLVLQDTDTRLIVDFIHEALPE